MSAVGRLAGRLLRWAAFGLPVLAIVTLALAWSLDHFASQKVLMITPSAPKVVKLNRGLWMQGDPVAEIYGIPANREVSVVFPNKDHLLRPQEDRSLLLLRVNKQAGENPLQVQTVWFIAWRAAGAVAGFWALSLFALVILRRRCGSQKSSNISPKIDIARV